MVLKLLPFSVRLGVGVKHLCSLEICVLCAVLCVQRVSAGQVHPTAPL